MKAITVCQPYAYLLCLPTNDDEHKRIENRTWYTGYRGPLAIHAGKSRKWLDTWDGRPIPESEIVFGAVVGVGTLIDCLHIDRVRRLVTGPRLWVKHHIHAKGPYCWILAPAVRPLVPPVPCLGSLGLWDVPESLFTQPQAPLPLFGAK